MFQFLSGDLNARNQRGSPSYPQIAPPLKPHSPPKPVQNESNKTPSSSTSIRTQNQNPETPRNPVSAREQNRTTSATRNGPEESQTNHKTAEPKKKRVRAHAHIHQCQQNHLETSSSKEDSARPRGCSVHWRRRKSGGRS